MDTNLRRPYEATSRINFEDEIPSIFPDPNSINWLNASDSMVGWNQLSENLVLQSDPRLNVVSLLNEASGHKDYNLRDIMLKCINQMLMEDDMEEKSYMLQQSSALKAAEKSLYEAIGAKYPPSPHLHRVSDLHQNENYGDSTSGNRDLLCPDWVRDPRKCQTSNGNNVDLSVVSQSSHDLFSTIDDGIVDFPVSTITIPDMFNNYSEYIKRGAGEASKFFDKVESTEKNHGNQYFVDGSRGKKNMHREEDDTDLPEGRSYKQPAISTEQTVKLEVFDEVLLGGEEDESTLCHALWSVSCDNTIDNDDSKKRNGKKKGHKSNVVDLRSLLTLCAQTIAADDRKTANEYLKHIRQHSSPTGDDMQRLAHYFADGLEARIEGSGTRIYKALVKYPRSATKALKAWQLYLTSCPFRKISNFFSNKTITSLAQNASSVHIIDFGIWFGFQWPCLIQRLSVRPGGPPKLRITGVDFPLPGFQLAERVKETGRLLAYYAEKFNVPFEFNAIAKKWETVTVEDLKIRKGEVLVANCLFKLRNLLDDTVIPNGLNPRDIVLKLIRELRPDVFVHGILNSACNSPFFVSRFRAALSHYSAVFDMLEATIPREVHERMLLENFIFGRQAMNVIACEDTERIERPETYKQWQVRNTRAGFLQLPLNEEITKQARHWLRSYHKDFVIDEDGKWLLLGWKGRPIYALSSWKPA